MSLLIRIDHNPTTPGEPSKAKPEMLVSGDPSYLTWPLDLSREAARSGSVHTGVWEATAGEHLSIKNESFEFCHLLAGKAELIEEGKEPRTFVAGDSFIMKPGYRGVWRTIETVRKIYVIVS